MSLRFDIHLHTSRYSQCSRTDASRLIKQAVRVRLDGIVITEHHRIWHQKELDDLVAESGEPGFLLLSAFEYTSSQGDILIYGLKPGEERRFVPGRSPEKAVAMAQDMGAACIGAHPTRAGMSFDERIATLPLDALEVGSVNLKPHEQRLAMKLAQQLNMPPVTCSDSHRLEDVGRYATDFHVPVSTMPDFVAALKGGHFGISQSTSKGAHQSWPTMTP